MLSFLKNIFKKPEAKPRLTLPSHTPTPAPAQQQSPPSQPQAKAQAQPPPPVEEKPAAKSKGKTKPQPAANQVKQSRPEKPGAGATAKAKEEWARQAARQISPDATPEQLCGIVAGMTKEQVSAQLAILYRRHNRAASSLEERLREEAEIMLDVIAAMRQKYVTEL